MAERNQVKLTWVLGQKFIHFRKVDGIVKAVVIAEVPPKLQNILFVNAKSCSARGLKFKELRHQKMCSFVKSQSPRSQYVIFLSVCNNERQEEAFATSNNLHFQTPWTSRDYSNETKKNLPRENSKLE